MAGISKGLLALSKLNQASPSTGLLNIGPSAVAEQAAIDYAKRSGIPYTPSTSVGPNDPIFGARVAKEYEAMQHNPTNPRVKQSYDALSDEVAGQYEEMLRAGIKPEFNSNPESPYRSLMDMMETGRLDVYPTQAGFGAGDFDPTGNPLLKESPFKISGQPASYNDLFRAVHDFQGHAKKGAGFRAAGEDLAYLSHAGTMSPEALKALASETRGQNSWLNYGPFGDKNRTAGIEDTIFADQKTGLLPNWAIQERLPELDARRKRFSELAALGDTGLEGAIDDAGNLTLIHYSPRPVERIDPAYYGSGLSRRTRDEVNRGYGEDFVPRSFYGIEADTNPYRKELGLGNNKVQTQIDAAQMYDPQKDPEGLWKAGKGDLNKSEKNLWDKGYSGYFVNTKQSGKVAAMFDPLDVTKKLMVPLLAAPIAFQSEDSDAGPLTKGAKRLIDSRFSSAVGGGKERKGVLEAVETMQTGVEPRLMDTGPQRSLYDFMGSPYILTQSDRSAAGGILGSLHGKAIDPIDLRGGRDFMFDPSSEGQVWASDPNVVRSLHNRALELKREFGQDPLLLPYTMAPTGIDFSTMPLDTMINYARQGMSKANIKKLDGQIKAVIPRWGGISDPASNAIFREVKGPARKKVADIIDKNYRDVEGGLSISEARAATTDAGQYMEAEGTLKNIGRIDTSAGLLSESGHPTYRFGLPGEGVGTLAESINARPLIENSGRVLANDMSDIRALSMNHAISQGVVDEKLLKRIYGQADPKLLGAMALGTAAAIPAVGGLPSNQAEAQAIETEQEQEPQGIFNQFNGEAPITDMMSHAILGIGRDAIGSAAGVLSPNWAEPVKDAIYPEDARGQLAKDWSSKVGDTLSPIVDKYIAPAIQNYAAPAARSAYENKPLVGYSAKETVGGLMDLYGKLPASVRDELSPRLKHLGGLLASVL